MKKVKKGKAPVFARIIDAQQYWPSCTNTKASLTF